MTAADNPFRTARLEALAYRPAVDLVERALVLRRSAIVGPMGTGKTTLLGELARGLRARGFEVVSAVVRVYRSAMAVQVQREHYESKWVRLVALRAQFDGARSAAEKQAVMNEVEVLETEELRQFLRQMRRASFLL